MSTSAFTQVGKRTFVRSDQVESVSVSLVAPEREYPMVCVQLISGRQVEVLCKTDEVAIAYMEKLVRDANLSR